MHQSNCKFHGNPSNCLDQNGWPADTDIPLTSLLEGLKIWRCQGSLSVHSSWDHATSAFKHKSTVAYVTNTFLQWHLANCETGKWKRKNQSASARLPPIESAVPFTMNFFLPPRRIIAVIHQNPTNDEFHRLPADWEGRGMRWRLSLRELSEWGSERPAEWKKTKWESEKEETDYQLPSMNKALRVPCLGC